MPNDDGKKEYEVGYKKPPKQHRFKKGQSGNPRGFKPKATKNIHQALMDEMMTKVTVNEGGKIYKITKMEALFKSAVAKAIKTGDFKYVKFLLEQTNKFRIKLNEPIHVVHRVIRPDGKGAFHMVDDNGKIIPFGKQEEDEAAKNIYTWKLDPDEVIDPEKDPL